MKTVVRTLIAEWLIVSTLISTCFLVDPFYWGYKYPQMRLAIQTIFFPREYDENVERWLIGVGRARLRTEHPGSAVVEDTMFGDSTYLCKYIDADGNMQTYNTII